MSIYIWAMKNICVQEFESVGAVRLQDNYLKSLCHSLYIIKNKEKFGSKSILFFVNLLITFMFEKLEFSGHKRSLCCFSIGWSNCKEQDKMGVSTK